MDHYRVSHSINFHENLPLTVKRMEPQTDLGLHSHDFNELVIIENGRGNHFTQDEAYPVARGDVFIIARDEAHGYAETDGLVLANIIFRPEKLSLPMAQFRRMPGYHAIFSLEPHYRKQHQFAGRLRLSHQKTIGAMKIVDSLKDEIDHAEVGFEIAAISMMSQLMVYLSRGYSTMKQDAPKRIFRLGEVLSHVERNFCEEIDLMQLKEIAHMSTSTLLRSFHDAVGMAPLEYIMHLRIERAAELLRDSKLPVTDIAFKAGFTDSNYFSRQFRKNKKCSPTAWRKRYS